MYINVNFSQFCDSFSDTYKGNFSYDGKRALFDYLESYEEDTGEKIELDTVALCCEYTEYDNLKDVQEVYSNTNIKSIEDLREHTTVIEIEGKENIIIQDF